MTRLIGPLRRAGKGVIASPPNEWNSGDAKRFRGFEANLKVYPPEALVDAYQQAKNPKAKNPGAIFMHALKRHEEA